MRILSVSETANIVRLDPGKIYFNREIIGRFYYIRGGMPVLMAPCFMDQLVKNRMDLVMIDADPLTSMDCDARIIPIQNPL